MKPGDSHSAKHSQMEPVVGELQGPGEANSNLLGLPELCLWDTDDEQLGLGGIKPKSSPIPRRRSSSSSCSEDEIQSPPSSSRRVSFADAFGFSLVSVKQFDTWSVCDHSDPLEKDSNDTKEYILNLQFALPSSQEELLCKVREQKIELESLEILPGTTTLKGTVCVFNMCFDKLVYIRTSLDCWRSHFDLLAQYLPGSNSRYTDRFSFKLTLVPPFGEQGARVDFCLRYETPLGTFWASGGGKNYVLFCHEKAKEQEENENKSKPKSCLKATSYGFCTKTGTNSNTEESPEIAATVSKPVSITEEKSEEEFVKLQLENCRHQSRKSRRKAARMAKIQQYFAQREENGLYQIERNAGDVTSGTNRNEQVPATDETTEGAEHTEIILPSLTEPQNMRKQIYHVNTKTEQIFVSPTQGRILEMEEKEESQTTLLAKSEKGHKSPVGCGLQVLEKHQSVETLTEQIDTALLMQDLPDTQIADKSITKSVEKAWKCFEKDAVKKTIGTLHRNNPESKGGYEENKESNYISDVQSSSQNFTFATIVAPLYHQVFKRLENERRDPMKRAQKFKTDESSGKLEDGSLRAVTEYPSYPRVQYVEPGTNPCTSEKQNVYQRTCKETCSNYLLSQKDSVHKLAAKTELHNPALKETQVVTSTQQTLLTSNMACQYESSPNVLSWEESALDQAEEMAEMILQNEKISEISDKPSIHIIPSLDNSSTDPETKHYNEVPKQDNVRSQATTLNANIKFLDELYFAAQEHSDKSENVKPIKQDDTPTHFQNQAENPPIYIQHQILTSSKLTPGTTGTNLFQEVQDLIQKPAELQLGTEIESKSGEEIFHSTNVSGPIVVFPDNHKETPGDFISTNNLIPSQKNKDANINVPDWTRDSNLDLTVKNICDKGVNKNNEQDPVMKEYRVVMMKDTWKVKEELEDKMEVILQNELTLMSTSDTALQINSLNRKILTQQSELDLTSGRSSAVHSENLPSVVSLVTNLCFKNRPCETTSKQNEDDNPKRAEEPTPDLLTNFDIPLKISSDISQSGALLHFENQIQNMNQTQIKDMRAFPHIPELSCIAPANAHVTEGTNLIYNLNQISQEGDDYVDNNRKLGSGNNDDVCCEERTLTLSHSATDNIQANKSHLNPREKVDMISQSLQHVGQISTTVNQVQSILCLNSSSNKTFNDSMGTGVQERNINEDQFSTLTNKTASPRASKENVITTRNNKAQESIIMREHQLGKIQEIQAEDHLENKGVNPIVESLFQLDIQLDAPCDTCGSRALNLIQGTSQTQNDSLERTGITYFHVTDGANLVQESINSRHVDADGTNKTFRSIENDFNSVNLTLPSETDTTLSTYTCVNPDHVTIVDTIPPDNAHFGQIEENQESILDINATLDKNNDLDTELQKQLTSNTFIQDSGEHSRAGYLKNEDTDRYRTDLSQPVYHLDTIKLSNIKQTLCQSNAVKAASNDNSDNYTFLKWESNSTSEQNENIDDSASTESLSDDEMELYLYRLKKTQPPGLKEAVSMAKRPSISKSRTISPSLPSISEYIDEDQPNVIMDNLTNEEIAMLEKTTLSTSQEEIVISQKTLWRDLFSFNNPYQIIVYIFLLVVFFIVTYFCDFIACFGLYLLAIYGLYFKNKENL